ncbi:hypothetical protein HPB50_004379 [Hyalomma asiaticum]|uniref:Uncharacterized protein n=1 Tax=Hyalomma asiaticum TaxID=266040 RepID=A0ACB7SJQ3_HYAAI|nr:hypothetical protein HPB50_004379 [Hyalomma asiaticum]
MGSGAPCCRGLLQSASWRLDALSPGVPPLLWKDWDFPHFVCDLNIKLPGLSAASFKYHMFQKYVHLPEIVFHISGKWFNYGIIVVVMLLDLNMWKNQIFYQPEDYGQYTGPDNKVRTVINYATLATGE